MNDCDHVVSQVEVDGHHFCVKCDWCADGNPARRNAIYSGPGKTGICTCGHSFQDHHLGMVARLGAVLTAQGIHEYYIPQECDHYGFNELGGMMPQEGSDGEWTVHCFGYKDSGDA